MVFINNQVDLFYLFENLEPIYKKEIFDFIKFLKTRPNFETFKNYNISSEAFKIYAYSIDILVKKFIK